MTIPAKPFESQSVIDALSGTIDDDTGVDYIPKGTNPSSTPPLATRYWRVFQRVNAMLADVAGQGKAWHTQNGLNIGVSPCVFMLGGVVKTFVGAENQLVADDLTTYVWLDATPAVQTGVALPADQTTFLPVAQVVAVGGAITSITDLRSRIALLVPQNLSAAYANDTLSNLGVVAINAALLLATDNAHDIGAAAKALRSLYLRTSLILKQAGFNYTVTWADPAQAVAVSIIDPGVAATQVILAHGAQTMANKTLTAPTIADLVNMPHDHSAASKGGLLTNTAFGTGKYFSVAIATHFEAGTLAVGVLAAEFVAPFAFTLRNATGRVKTAPTGDTLIVDVRINGTSIFALQSEMVSIVAAAFQATSATTDYAVSTGDVITYEVEQVGSTVAGADLTLVCNGLAASTV